MVVMKMTTFTISAQSAAAILVNELECKRGY